jgi:hypothetical protein
MCDKLPYENPRIDKCLIQLIKEINSEGTYKSLASCCGHDKYPTTIVVKDKDNNIFEYFTKKKLKKPKRNRFYKKDGSNYYYLNPELILQ